MARESVGLQCGACNDMEQSGALRIEGEAPLEKYYRRDGSFLGFGFDPEPWSRVSHVGHSHRSRNGAVRRPDERSRSPG